MKYSKKLIEVALPLEAINAASAREKSIRHGHPSTLHLWWARRPLAAARAVIFAQMVAAPSAPPGFFRTEKAQEKERERLLKIIEDLVQWENTTNEEVLERPGPNLAELARSCAENADSSKGEGELFDRHKLPAFHDPFAGGGALPLEAQRLGLEAYASDLNPVAVLINKAMIEIPPKFAGKPPVNPESRTNKNLFAREWKGAQGLAEDVRYYGKWMRDEAEKRIGHLYPKVEITAEMAKERRDLKPYVGRKLTVIEWLWARTVKSPNPAFAHVDVPLASTFMLSTKPGKEAYVEPVIEKDGYRFTVKMGKPKNAEAAKNGTKLARGANFQCLMSGTPIASEHIKDEGRAGLMGSRLMEIVAEGDRGRIYLTPTLEHEEAARKASPKWKPETPLAPDPRALWTPPYGLTTYGDLFTPRQIVALTTFSDLVGEARERIRMDALGARASGPQSHPPKGWHSRGYLHHCDIPGLLQHITVRLSDSVPAELIESWRSELRLSAKVAASDSRQARLREKIEKYADEGHGKCWLKDPRIAELVENALLHFDGERYRLIEWCVMPNHFHALIETIEGHSLSDVVHSWKTFTAREANLLLGREGAFWMPDYFDRFIRNEQHLEAVKEYVRNNPVKAGLCSNPEDWRWSSAHAREFGLNVRAGGPRSQDADGGTGVVAYADSIASYLSIALSPLSDICNALCRWEVTKTQVRNLFGRQAIPMLWDFAENNVFASAAGDYLVSLQNMVKALEQVPASHEGRVFQDNAQLQALSRAKIVSTDPPYYDNIGYADLSDFFYVWLRRSLKQVYPDLFSTLAVPKAEELVATPYRHGSKEKAEAFFLDGMTQAMHRLAEQTHPAFPVTIYYAFKQSETLGARASGPLDANAGADARTPRSTGWETFLDAVIRAGFAISGTWPMRTELSNRMIGSGTNALASSIIIVCRQRAAALPTATRREFVSALKAELPPALLHLQRGNIAPVDLAQAAIGPGMAVYTRYAKVLDAEGKPLSVREALALINQTLDEVLAEQEGDFDADTRWALAWFEQSGFGEGEYGVAETLSKAKNTSVSGMVSAGILESSKGKVRLLKPAELPAKWNPETDTRLTVWEMVHHLIRVLETGGESAAAELAAKLGGKAETARELCYRLYTICERKKRAQEALSYNALVQSWPEIVRLMREDSGTKTKQAEMFE
jgi:putative DNA methylase